MKGLGHGEVRPPARGRDARVHVCGKELGLLLALPLQPGLLHGFSRVSSRTALAAPALRRDSCRGARLGFQVCLVPPLEAWKGQLYAAPLAHAPPVLSNNAFDLASEGLSDAHGAELSASHQGEPPFAAMAKVAQGLRRPR